jgi:hypothetical protein
MNQPTELTGAKPSFTALPNWLRGKATPLELAVMWTLQSHYPEIRPSIGRLAQEACISERTVRRVLDDLIRKGWLAKRMRRDDNGRNMANVYELRVWSENPPAVEPEHEQDRKHREVAARRSRVSPKQGEGVTESPRPVTLTPHPVRQSPPNPAQSQPPQATWGEGVTLPGVSQRQGGGCHSDRGEGVTVTPEVKQEEEIQEEETKPTALRTRTRKPRTTAFNPTADDIPADLLPVQHDLLDFWAEKRGARSQRAWDGLCAELQKIHRDPNGGADTLRAQLNAAIQAGWQSVTYANWQRYAAPAQHLLPLGSRQGGRYTSRAEREQSACDDVVAFLSIADPDFAPPSHRTTAPPLRHA